MSKPPTETLVSFLSSSLVSSLLCTHPNALFLDGWEKPKEWESWWSWAGSPVLTPSRSSDDERCGEQSSRWEEIAIEYARAVRETASVPLEASDSQMPQDLLNAIHIAASLNLPRNPDYIYSETSRSPPRGPPSINTLHGMSPKKSHEVTQMSTYIMQLLENEEALRSVRRVVDVGSGQGYLTRSLASFGLHVLALDADPCQTEGAEKREDVTKKAKSRFIHEHAYKDNSTGRVDNHTIFITSQTLMNAVDAWMKEEPLSSDRIAHGPEPILFVALHACGSLTPATLRVACSSRSPSEGRPWRAAGCVVVGCCYNLMDLGGHSDFPLSTHLKNILSTKAPSSTRQSSDIIADYTLSLTPSHLQLATQVPSQWLRDKRSRDSQALAMRKVAWRAVVGHKLFGAVSASNSVLNVDVHTGQHPMNLRLGRLPDRAYRSWIEFTKQVDIRLHANDHQLSSIDMGPLLPTSEEDIRRVEVIQTLRCILGPVVESLIVLDRVKWVEELLVDGSDPSNPSWEQSEAVVRLVRLFDQARGSARNLAIAIV